VIDLNCVLICLRLDNFYASSTETFEPYYGKYDDGDIYRPENIDSLFMKVMDVTAGAGVHFMMADGVSSCC